MGGCDITCYYYNNITANRQMNVASLLTGRAHSSPLFSHFNPSPSGPLDLFICSEVGDAAFRFNLIFFDTTICDTQTETKQKYIFAHKDEEARLSEE